MKKLFLSLAFLLPAMGMMAQTQVKTAEGILEGKELSGIKVFKGVPFAAPPVGNLRWKAPPPHAPCWSNPAARPKRLTAFAG